MVFRKCFVVIYFICVRWLCGSVVVSVSDGVYAMDPPLIVTSTSPIVTKAGDNMTVECRGKHPVQWVVRDILQNESFETQERMSDTVDEYPHVSTLVVRHLLYNNTGLYHCAYSGTTDMSSLENVTSLYVYVYDSDHLFAPVQPRSLYGDLVFHPVHQHKESVIPCRPTHPDVQVRLFKQHTLVNISTDAGIEYDRTQGFLMRYPNSFFNGYFECRAAYENFTAIRIIHLQWMPDTKAAPEPEIDDSDAQHINVGSSFSLTCIARIEIGTMLFINWTTPHILDRRITVGDTIAVNKISNNGYQYRIISGKLTISEAFSKDQGVYRCTVTDHTDKSNFHEKMIKVYNETSHVHLSSDIRGPLVHPAGKDKIIFVIKVDSYPKAVITWHKVGTSRDEVLVKGHKYEMGNSDAKHTTLTIRNLSIQDSGNYTVVAKTLGIASNFTIALTVTERPTVNISIDSHIVRAGSRVRINCTIIGSPLPEIHWEWKACDNPNACDEHFVPFRQATHNSPRMIYDKVIEGYRRIGILEVTAEQSGYFMCNASNNIGHNHNFVPFVVSDVPNGFAAFQNEARGPIETLPYSLQCHASNFLYSGIVWLWQPSADGDKMVVVNNNTDAKLVSVTEIASRYSNIHAIHFDNMTSRFSGKYICKADSIEEPGRMISKALHVEPKLPQRPRFVETNMNGSFIEGVQNEHYEFLCKATGVPDPVTTWMKNGKTINSTVVSDIKFKDTNTVLVITRAHSGDHGMYTCVVSNVAGTISANVSLQMPDDPLMEQSSVRSTATVSTAIVAAVILIATIIVLVLIAKIQQEKKHRRLDLQALASMFDGKDLEECLKQDGNSYDPNLPLEDQVELLPYYKHWEFPKERLKLGRTLGQGAFGRVVKAEAIGLRDGEDSTTVAVKMLRERADTNQMKALAQELKIMVHLGRHLNVVNLLGAVTKSIHKGQLLVIVEYCRYGNLRHFLLQNRDNFQNQTTTTTFEVDPLSANYLCPKRTKSLSSPTDHGRSNNSYSNLDVVDTRKVIDRHPRSISTQSDTFEADLTVQTDVSIVSDYPVLEDRSDTSFSGGSRTGGQWTKMRRISTRDLMCYAYQVARGMEYLASRKLVHRDLAARNVLLADNNIVKICDFGLAKDVYKYSNYKRKGEGPLPIKWMAVESIGDKVFSTQSDVWSYGVMLWEFFTLGGTPYPGIEINEWFYKKLKNGYRMEKPEFASFAIYDVMQQCWLANPNDRPSFTWLAEKLGNELESSIRKYYVNLTGCYNGEIPPTVNNDYLSMVVSESPSYTNSPLELSALHQQAHYVNIPDQAPVELCTSNDTSNYLNMRSPTKCGTEVFQPFWDNCYDHKLLDDAAAGACAGPQKGLLQDDDELTPFLSQQGQKNPDNVDRSIQIRSSDYESKDQSRFPFVPAAGMSSDCGHVINTMENNSVMSNDSGFNAFDCADSVPPPSYNLLYASNRLRGGF